VTASYRLYDSIDEVPLNDWAEASQEGSHGFMDPGFLRAMEQGFAGEAKFFHVLIDDADGGPAACASLCLMEVDPLLLAGPRLRRVVGWSRRWFPGLGKFTVLLCGLPLSAGQSHLAFAPGADRARAVVQLDGVMQQVARRHGARLIVFKEFGDEDRAHMDQLVPLGYCRADSPASYALARTFPSLKAYCDALKRHYRSEVTRSQKKFARAGCRAVHLDDPEEIRRVYTPEVHRLYEAVVGKAEMKLEILPHRFFHALAAELAGVTLTAVYRAEQVVALGWSLTSGDAFHGLFCGIDYAHNADCDLYFNVMYQSLDLAFRRGCQHITLGQTAETFKTRLGCAGTKRYLYARGAGSLLSWALRRSASFLFPPRPAQDANDVFKATDAPSPAKKSKAPALAI
jgi:predicted N-acyltransferase